MENKQLKFLDLFAGIGGFRFGMESAGHKCVGFAEIDKFARESYKAIHNTEGEIEYHDVTAVTNEQWAELKGKVDVICGGFPCQSFSVAGKRRGFLDDVRGTLFFEIARAAQQIKPRILFMENVKGLLSHDKGNTFRTILSTLDELGYDAEWEIFNSKNFGVPQNRERVFIIGHLRGERGREIFPFGRKDGKPNEERQIKIVGSTKGAHQTSLGQRDLVYNAEGLIGTLTATDYKQPKVVGIPIKQIGNIDQANRKRKNPHTGRIYDPTGVSPSLSTMQGGGLEPKIVVKNPLKGMTNNGWHFEQQVYEEDGLTRALKAGGGSGNIPKLVVSDDAVIPVQTPEIANKSQNGRRFKEEGDPMYTLTAKDRHGVAIIQRKRGFNEGGEHEIAPTLSSNSWEQNNLLKFGGVYTNDSPSHNRGILPNTSRTLKSQNHDAGVFDGMRIRKLTPKECWRLQGFPDWSYEKAQEVNSNSQLYKQAGNSVTVNVISAIAHELY